MSPNFRTTSLVLRKYASVKRATSPGERVSSTSRARGFAGSGRGGNLPLDARALLLERLGEPECELKRLARVEPRVAMGMVAVAERGLGNRLRAADAFGHILSGHLEVDAAG